MGRVQTRPATQPLQRPPLAERRHHPHPRHGAVASLVLAFLYIDRAARPATCIHMDGGVDLAAVVEQVSKRSLQLSEVSVLAKDKLEQSKLNGCTGHLSWISSLKAL